MKRATKARSIDRPIADDLWPSGWVVSFSKARTEGEKEETKFENREEKTGRFMAGCVISTLDSRLLFFPSEIEHETARPALVLSMSRD